MSDRYLSETYGWKDLNVDSGRIEPDPTLPLELQIQASVVRGNRDYVEGRYRAAIQEYLSAWRSFPLLASITDATGTLSPSDDELLTTDLSASFVATASLLLRRRANHHVSSSTGNDQRQLTIQPALSQHKSPAAVTSPYEAALSLLRGGALDAARMQVIKAARAPQQSHAIQGDIRNLHGIITLIGGDQSAARDLLRQASKLYQSAGMTDAMAATQYNLGVAALLAGDYQQATELLATIAHVPFLDVSWQLSRSTLPGVASVAVTVESPGIPLMVRAGDGVWEKISSAKPPATIASVVLMRSGGPLLINLERSKQVGLVSQLLEPRIQATTLDDLNAALHDPTSFVAHLAHVQAFVLPLSLGDAFFALGDYRRAEPFYLKARDYPYLNRAIERPLVWRRLAATCVAQGRVLLQDSRADEARELIGRVAHFETEVPDRRLFGGRTARAVPELRLMGPLYAGPFTDLEPLARKCLLGDDPLEADDLDHETRIHLLEAAMLLGQITQGGPGTESVSKSPPISSWHQLEEWTQTLEAQAGQIEQIWIEAVSQAARDEFSRESYERIVVGHALAQDATTHRLRRAETERSIIHQCAAYAAERLSFIATLIPSDDDERNVARQATALAWTESARRPATLSSVIQFTRTPSSLARPGNRFASPRATQLLASHAGEQLILENRTRFYEAARLEIDAHLTAAEHAFESANHLQAIATLRTRWAQAQLTGFEAASCEPERRMIALRTLRLAYEDTRRLAGETAVLAERAKTHELEGVVWSSTQDFMERSGTLLGRTVETPPRQTRSASPEPGVRFPFEISIALATSLPHQFSSQFWSSGRMDFASSLHEIEQQVPGAVAARITRVDVEFELRHDLPRFHATLRHAGISQSRDRDGEVRLSLHHPRTALVQMVSDGDRNETATGAWRSINDFAGLPGACDWILQVKPAGTTLDLTAIADVRVTIHGDALATSGLELPADAVDSAPVQLEAAVYLSLGARAPHEFALFSTTGTARFAIDTSIIPEDRIEPRLTNLIVVPDAPAHPLPPGLVVTVIHPSGELTIDQIVDEHGVIATDRTISPLNSLRGLSPLGQWTVRIDRARNAEAFAAGFRWSNLSNITVVAEFDYTRTPRTLASAESPIDEQPEPPLARQSRWRKRAKVA